MEPRKRKSRTKWSKAADKALLQVVRELKAELNSPDSKDDKTLHSELTGFWKTVANRLEPKGFSVSGGDACYQRFHRIRKKGETLDSSIRPQHIWTEEETSKLSALADAHRHLNGTLDWSTTFPAFKDWWDSKNESDSFPFTLNTCRQHLNDEKRRAKKALASAASAQNSSTSFSTSDAEACEPLVRLASPTSATQWAPRQDSRSPPETTRNATPLQDTHPAQPGANRSSYWSVVLSPGKREGCIRVVDRSVEYLHSLRSPYSLSRQQISQRRVWAHRVRGRLVETGLI